MGYYIDDALLSSSGAIAVADVTGDGNPEIFVPSYEKGEIHVYSYDK